jgi:hypothetical protein
MNVKVAKLQECTKINLVPKEDIIDFADIFISHTSPIRKRSMLSLNDEDQDENDIATTTRKLKKKQKPSSQKLKQPRFPQDQRKTGCADDLITGHPKLYADENDTTTPMVDRLEKLERAVKDLKENDMVLRTLKLTAELAMIQTKSAMLLNEVLLLARKVMDEPNNTNLQ